VLEGLEKTREEEAQLLEKMSEKYGKKFTANDLVENSQLMKIVAFYPTGDEEDGGHMSLSLQTEKYKGSIGFGRGEPEDMTLYRDLSDALHIEEMLVAAYNAGKNGEELIVEYEEEDEEDEEED
jgi:hypothetical protein